MKRNGLLAGLVFAAWQYIVFFTGINKTDFGSFSIFVPIPVYIVCLFMAIRAKRAELGGFMEFADGLKTGLGASAITAIVYSISKYIYARWVNLNWIAEYTNVQNPDSQLYTPFRVSLVALAGILFMGGIISIILAATMRKKQPTHTV